MWETIDTSIAKLSKRRLAELNRKAEADPEFVERFVNELVLAMLPVGATSMANTFDRQTPATVRERQQIRNGFQKRLWKYWGPAFRRLDVMVHCLWDYGADLLADLEDNPELGKDPTYVALSRLMARGTRVAGEVHALLLAGYADGALARWRTLYEVSITATFIARRGNEVAARYLAHEELQRIKSTELHQYHAARRQEIPLPVDEFERIVKRRIELVDQHGKHFDRDFGWAAAPGTKSIDSFKDLEAHCDLSHVRPIYRSASAEVHAGADGMRGLGTSVGRTDIFLAPGPSNAGLAKPGMYTAHSIAFLAATPMLHRTSFDRMLRASAFGELARRCTRAFEEGELKLRRAEKIAATERRKFARKRAIAAKAKRDRKRTPKP